MPWANYPDRHSEAPGASIGQVPRLAIDDLLDAARARLDRVDAADARDALQRGATLIDIRSDSQVAEDGTVPGALLIARNVLEWRLDPAGGHRHPDAPDLSDHVIVMCDAGYASSLAAASLQQLGFARATDLVGGYQAWRAAGLPTVSPTGGGSPAGSQSSVRVSQNASPANSP
jgi:rhodanese-related sulfurtransferase